VSDWATVLVGATTAFAALAGTWLTGRRTLEAVRAEQQGRFAEERRAERLEAVVQLAGFAGEAASFARSAMSDRSLFKGDPTELADKASTVNLRFRSIANRAKILSSCRVGDEVTRVVDAHEALGTLLDDAVPAPDHRWDEGRQRLDQAVNALLEAARAEFNGSCA
jgi:hypothetical protein